MSQKTALIILHEGVEEMEIVAPIDILRRGGIRVTVAAAGETLAVCGRNGIHLTANALLGDALKGNGDTLLSRNDATPDTGNDAMAHSDNAPHTGNGNDARPHTGNGNAPRTANTPEHHSGVYDLIVVPGGPGVAALRQNTQLRDALTAHAEHGRLIGAICAAPLVLLDAGLLDAQGTAAPYTAHPSTSAELPAADATQSVVVSISAGLGNDSGHNTNDDHSTNGANNNHNTNSANNTGSNSHACTCGKTSPVTRATTAAPLSGTPLRIITSRGAGTATAFALTLLEHLIGGEQGQRVARDVAESICLREPQ